MNIVNVKSGQPYDIYCGRENKTYNLLQSKWANPFVIGKDGIREQVILKFRLWINSQPDLLVALPELKSKTLSCWCNYPEEDCHCRILHELSESKYIRNWFSNMLSFNFPFLYQGMEFKTVENFYQAMKIPKNKLDLRRQIAEMPPHKSKTEIRNKEKFLWREDWDKDLALKVMKFVLNFKFQKGTSWAEKLKMTEDWEIVEWNNWGDKFWGKDIKTKDGENHLGRILMEIRSEL